MAQTNAEIETAAKVKMREFEAVFNTLTDVQKNKIYAVLKKYEENKGDYQEVTSPYPNSKFSVMRENYASDILPEIKEALTEEQFDVFTMYLTPQ